MPSHSPRGARCRARLRSTLAKLMVFQSRAAEIPLAASVITSRCCSGVIGSPDTRPPAGHGRGGGRPGAGEGGAGRGGGGWGGGGAPPQRGGGGGGDVRGEDRAHLRAAVLPSGGGRML